jgi:hypothetical protein
MIYDILKQNGVKDENVLFLLFFFIKKKTN